MAFDVSSIISDRAHAMEASGVRKVFDLAKKIKNPVNLSIGQPHFDVPDNVKEVAIQAIRDGKNSYSQSQGDALLLDALLEYFPSGRYSKENLIAVAGVSGSLALAFLAILNEGDEIVTSDPYFISYKQLASMCGAKVNFFDTYPDFKLDAAKVEAAITPKTKCIIISNPGNPTGVLYTKEELKSLAEVASKHDLLIISDEIYRDFCYSGEYCSIADVYENTLVMGGFSKSHAMTGWRLGYAAGPSGLISEIIKIQQFSYVCAPSFAQVAGASALKFPLTDIIEEYKGKRDKIYDGLKSAGYEVERPEGAFYIFPKVPWGTDLEFVEEAIKNELLIIPGSVFSEQNTHFRISYAASDQTLDKGIELLAKIINK